MRDDFFWRTIHEDSAIVQNIGAVDNAKAVADIVVGNQNADATIFQMRNQFADFADRNGVDPGERFIEQNELWTCGKSAGDFNASAFTARESE